jgi:hypothetical protein
MFERAFVLVPLAEIAGDKVIAGKRVSGGHPETADVTLAWGAPCL